MKRIKSAMSVPRQLLKIANASGVLCAWSAFCICASCICHAIASAACGSICAFALRSAARLATLRCADLKPLSLKRGLRPGPECSSFEENNLFKTPALHRHCLLQAINPHLPESWLNMCTFSHLSASFQPIMC